MADKWMGNPPQWLLPRLRMLTADLEALSQGKYPAAGSVVDIGNCVLTTRKVPCLVGEFSGHPTLPDGPAITSELFYLDRQKRIGRTLSRWYLFEDGLIDLQAGD